MSVIQITASNELTKRQRWSLYLTFGFGLLAFFVGINLRDSLLYATTVYVNREVGIQANYPENWLIDSDGDYVFRVRDIARLGFKTTIQVGILPISSETTAARNVLDAQTLTRSQVLADYNVQSIGDVLLPDDSEALRVNYTFVASDSNTFLEGIPVVVQGVDLLIIRRGQAIVITFLADLSTYEQDLEIFERFLSDLRLS